MSTGNGEQWWLESLESHTLAAHIGLPWWLALTHTKMKVPSLVEKQVSNPWQPVPTKIQTLQYVLFPNCWITKKDTVNYGKSIQHSRNHILQHVNLHSTSTPLKFNIAPEKIVVGRLLSYWEGHFSGGYLNFFGGWSKLFLQFHLKIPHLLLRFFFKQLKPKAQRIPSRLSLTTLTHHYQCPTQRR